MFNFKHKKIKEQEKGDHKNGEVRFDGQRTSSALSDRLANQVFLVLVVMELAVVALVGYFSFIKSAQQQLNLIEEEILPERQEEFVVLNEKYNRLKRVNEIFGNLDEAAVKKAEIVLPKNDGLTDLLVNLQAVVKESGFVLEGVVFKLPISIKDVQLETANMWQRMEQIGEETEVIVKTNEEMISNDKIQMIEIELRVRGMGYSGFKRLNSYLEKNLRIIDVKSFSFSPDNETFSMNLVTYYF